MHNAEDQRVNSATRRLAELGHLPAKSSISLLAGDGSDRLFIRIRPADQPSKIAVLPDATGKDFKKSRAEARATRLIGSHLFTHQVPVPQIITWDEASDIILFEDLGDVLLNTVAVDETTGFSPASKDLYHQAVAALAHMQVAGREGFDPDWCWDTPSYDRQLMLTKESDYFLTACCHDLLGITGTPEIKQEFLHLAEQAAQEPADFFLHRDFQSRNLMVTNSKIRIIDFQGGRMGPLGYDLASLLIDPYVNLPMDFRQELEDRYLVELEKKIPVDRSAFRQGYFYLALQRNLQILGAFAFLSHHKGKKFFRAFLKPAALNLKEHLAKPTGADYPYLRNLAATCLDRLP